MNNSRQARKKQRFRRRIKTFFAVSLLFLFTLGAGAFYFINQLHSVTADTQKELQRGEKSDLREEAVDPRRDNISVLFLGVDDRDGSLSGRTDAMILATFNKEDGTIKMASIPRDSYVEIPGRSEKDKINHAHAFGGTDLAIRTVENLLDIPVDYYVTLNFTAFIEIIDELGGVEVDVPFTFSEMDSYDNKGAITLYEGTQTLNGEEALAYARMRKHDPRGDIGRGERQQEIMQAIIEKGTSMSSITSYRSVLDSIENHLSMNLSFTDIISLHSYANSISDITSFTFEGDNTRINGIFYYDLHDDSVKEISTRFRQHLGLEEAPKEEPDEEVPNNVSN